MATIEIRKDELQGVKDFKSFITKLNEMYDGKWIAILDSGKLVADDTLEGVQKLAREKSTKIVFLFHASKKGELLLL